MKNVVNSGSSFFKEASQRKAKMNQLICVEFIKFIADGILNAVPKIQTLNFIQPCKNCSINQLCWSHGFELLE